jgi:hypothetical protein
MTSERRYTYREYLELEASSDVRYEFFDRVVYAMSGGSPDHSRLPPPSAMTAKRKPPTTGVSLASSATS